MKKAIGIWDQGSKIEHQVIWSDGLGVSIYVPGPVVQLTKCVGPAWAEDRGCKSAGSAEAHAHLLDA